jgi:hypothetical protein
MTKIFGQVPIDLYINNKLITREEWTLGYWEYTPNRIVWGLIVDGSPTHMCYGIDYAEPKDSVDKVREYGKYYFDAGGNGRPIYVTAKDLERGFKALGIWDEIPQEPTHDYTTCADPNVCNIHGLPYD